MIKVVFPKEPNYVKFFERVKDVDGNLILKPYLEFDYKGKNVKSDKHFSLLVKDISNEEFEFTLGKFIHTLIERCNPSSWSRRFQRCVNAIRWMEPVLSEFKETQYRYGIEIEIQLGKIKELRQWGSVGNAKEMKLSFKHLRSRDSTLYAFIHELIHIVQFDEGYNMYDPSVENELMMLEVAENYLSATTIPELWRSLI